MKSLISILSTCIMIFFPSCTDLDGYREFIENGEITYTGTAINLTAYPGNHRIKLTYGLIRNPNIYKSVIHWNARKDSIVLEFDRESSELIENDTLTYILTDLPEASYAFEVQNFDKLGNFSVPASITSKAYGEKYTATLYDRSLLSADAINQEGDVKMVWGDSTINSVGIEVKYTDLSNRQINLYIPNKETELLLKGCNTSEPIFYHTLYKPVENCIDTFATPFVQVEKVVAALDPSLFSEYRCDNDSPIIAGTMSNLWNGLRSVTNGNNYEWADEAGWADYNTGGTDDNLQVPGVFTVDLGIKAKLLRIRFNFYWPWQNACPKRYEIYGYLGNGAPNKNGDWSQWTRLKEIDNTGTETNEHYAEGDNIYFEDKATAPEVQYLRVKCLENYSGGQHTRISFSEIAFWAYL